jgi:hypothetical protein
VDDDRSSTFNLCPGVSLYGGFNGTETMLSERDFVTNQSILSGDLLQDDAANIPVADLLTDASRDDNAYSVVTGVDTDNSTIIDGFTITAGNANGDVDNDDMESDGAGMYNDEGSPIVRNCVFTANSAGDSGAGIDYDGVGTPMVFDCVFDGNFAGEDGGGIDQGASEGMIVRCIFRNNIAGDNGGGLWTAGSPDIINCSFIGNQANDDGGGVSLTDNQDFVPQPRIINCLFSGNIALAQGGALRVANENNAIIINTTFSGNSASEEGGAISNNNGATPTFINCIIWNNQANGSTNTSSASVYNNDASNPTFAYSIIANSGGSGGGWQAVIGTDNGDNKDEDPDFVDPLTPGLSTAGDYRLQITSPAIDMGDDAAVPDDIKDVDDDGDMDEPTPDLDLNDRIVGAMVDMGAYEFPCAAEAGEITNEDLIICQGDDPSTPFTANDTQTDAEYSYAYFLVDINGNIEQSNTDGNFNLSALLVGTYTVYGISYATFNTPTSVTEYLAGKSTLTEIQDDDSDNDGSFCLDLTENTATITVNEPATVQLNQTYPAVCLTKTVDLPALGAMIGGSATSATWSVLETDSDGTFSPSNVFGPAATFQPGKNDGLRGFVTLVLTTNDPDGPCPAVSAQIRITVLNVDCGNFPWRGDE